MFIDLHADTPLLQRWVNYDFCRCHGPWLPQGAWVANLDLPRMRSAQLVAQVFGLVSLPFEPDGGYATILKMIRRMAEAQESSMGTFELVRRGSQIPAATLRGVTCGVLSIEGVHALKGDMRRADELLALGVMSFGLCHFHKNEACRPAIGWGQDHTQGLTAFGRNLVAHLHAHGAIVDLTHINRAGYFDALEHTTGPVMVSHTGVYGVHPVWRNIDDDQIRAVANRGGIIGIIFSRHFLGGNDIEAVVRHVQHLVRTGGIECAALGSDFDGFIVPVKGLQDVTGLAALADALRRGGFSHADVGCIMGHNAQRFLMAALG